MVANVEDDAIVLGDLCALGGFEVGGIGIAFGLVAKDEALPILVSGEREVSRGGFGLVVECAFDSRTSGDEEDSDTGGARCNPAWSSQRAISSSEKPSRRC